jgi:hypothetical protein
MLPASASAGVGLTTRRTLASVVSICALAVSCVSDAVVFQTLAVGTVDRAAGQRNRQRDRVVALRPSASTREAEGRSTAKAATAHTRPSPCSSRCRIIEAPAVNVFGDVKDPNVAIISGFCTHRVDAVANSDAEFTVEARL